MKKPPKSLQERLAESAAKRAAKEAGKRSEKLSKGTADEKKAKKKKAEKSAWNRVAKETGLVKPKVVKKGRLVEATREDMPHVALDCQKHIFEDGELTETIDITPGRLPLETPRDGDPALGGYYKATRDHPTDHLGLICDSEGEIIAQTRVSSTLRLCRMNLESLLEYAINDDKTEDRKGKVKPSQIEIANGVCYSWIVPVKQVPSALWPKLSKKNAKKKAG